MQVVFDHTAQLYTQYQHELSMKWQKELFRRYAIVCPSCEEKFILPQRDYICNSCRSHR